MKAADSFLKNGYKKTSCCRMNLRQEVFYCPESIPANSDAKEPQRRARQQGRGG
ncbi:MAG: hypothetical protein E7512_05875 [[Clostridium] sporosphaeroides]|uniref:Uncharacterized protein n=1 Tax=Faecalispora sporosphaeroides TaxID=1549 RepID=A0A928Q4N0_9FIRM|nr:hypothetical protein [Faecalispora sporosphaeroides]